MRSGAGPIGAYSGVALAFLAWAAFAAQAPRSPQQTEIVLRLAETLGRTHALRQVCQGDENGSWYDRMQTLLRLEAPEGSNGAADLRRRLVERFNVGFNDEKAKFADCGRETQVEAQRLSEAGRADAALLSAP